MNEQLAGRVRKKFQEVFNQTPRLYFAPGRINLIGEHTDYNDGYVLPAAIDKAIYFAVAKNNTDKIRLYSIDYDEHFETDISHLNKSGTHWANYIIGVAAQFKRKGMDIQGLDCVFGGDIPLGAGLSSSAALECGFAVCLNEEFGLGVDRKELILMAQKAEHEFAGVHCGIMDQFASTFGRDGHVVRLDCRSLDFEYYPLTNDKVDLILCDTHVSHSLAYSEYNIRRQECEEGVDHLQSVFPEVKSLRDANPEMLEQVRNRMKDNVYRRCHYVIHEVIRVEKACQALVNEDFKTFGKLMYATHDGLSREYEVSCSELDILVDIARADPQVLGARMMGGGFGGCTINMIQNGGSGTFIRNVKSAYRDKTGRETTIYQVAISGGAGKI